MKHVTVVCDFCEEMIVNYTERVGESYPLHVMVSEIFGGHACDLCSKVMSDEAQRVLREVLKKKKEG